MCLKERIKLVDLLKKEGRIKSKSVEKAFLEIPRELFIPEQKKNHAYYDAPLQIGNGQTISAPHMVAIMCEALDIEEGQKILEIGTGSGYHAAIVSKMIGSNGHVFTIERHKDLAIRAKKAIEECEIKNVTIIIGDGSMGLEKHEPYDRIYVTCAAPDLPPPLLSQLNTSGKLLIPVGDIYCTLKLVAKIKNKIITKNMGGCVFVPLIGKYGH